MRITLETKRNACLRAPVIETKPLCASLSAFVDMLAIVRGWTLLILEVTGQSSRSQLTCIEISL